MKNKRILCTVLATTALLSATAFSSCNITDTREDVYAVWTVNGEYYNALLYEFKGKTVYYEKDEEEITLYLSPVNFTAPTYYDCPDARTHITEENDVEYESSTRLYKNHFSQAQIADLKISEDGYSDKYKSYLYANLTYELKEEKPLQLKENSDSFTITYYGVNYLNEEKTLYEWQTYKVELMKDYLIRIEYRVK